MAEVRSERQAGRGQGRRPSWVTSKMPGLFYTVKARAPVLPYAIAQSLGIRQSSTMTTPRSERLIKDVANGGPLKCWRPLSCYFTCVGSTAQ